MGSDEEQDDAEPGLWGLYWTVMGHLLQQRDVKGKPLLPIGGAELTDPLLNPDVGSATSKQAETFPDS